MTRLLPIAAAAALFAIGMGASPDSAPGCTDRQLASSFRVVPGSAGAGNILYGLRLRNTSRASCSVGRIRVSLLDRHGKRLPTHAALAPTTGLVRLRPGATEVATARFSPDVPGPGEPVAKPCEPTAYRLRMTLGGGGSLVVPIEPPTAVCEHGGMTFSPLRVA